MKEHDIDEDILKELSFYEDSSPKIKKDIEYLATAPKKRIKVPNIVKHIAWEWMDLSHVDIYVGNFWFLRPSSNLLQEVNFEKRFWAIRHRMQTRFNFPCHVVYQCFCSNNNNTFRPIQLADSIDVIERVFWYKKLSKHIKGVTIQKMYWRQPRTEKEHIKIRIYNLETIKEIKNDLQGNRTSELHREAEGLLDEGWQRKN